MKMRDDCDVRKVGSTTAHLSELRLSFSVIRQMVAIGLFGLLIGFERTALAAPPMVSIAEADLVAPDTALFDFYDNADNPCPAASCHRNTATPPEVTELASALGANRLSDAEFLQNVFEYVYRNIELSPMFGVQKGSLGAIVDQHGTAFDQVKLMADLVNLDTSLAGTVTFNFGTIELPFADAANWLGIAYIDGSSETFNQSAVLSLLADGGIPASVSGGDVKVAHVWLTIDSTVYDPSFKLKNYTDGVDIADAMGCSTGGTATCGEDARTAAMTGATSSTLSGTVPYISGINYGTLSTELNSFATGLQSSLQQNHPNSVLEDIVGRDEIDQALMPASGAITQARDESAIARTSQRSWTTIPDQLRTTFTFKFDNIDKTFFCG